MSEKTSDTLLIDGERYWLGACFGTYRASTDCFVFGNCFVAKDDTVYAGCLVQGEEERPLLGSEYDPEFDPANWDEQEASYDVGNDFQVGQEFEIIVLEDQVAGE